MIHGTRKAYRAGCSCCPCRAANAAAEAARRLRLLRGSADAFDRALEARRRVRQLEIEGYPKSRIAKLAGWTDGRGYHVNFRRGQRIRRSTFARILRVARYAMLEGLDTPAGRIKQAWEGESNG